MNDLVIRKIMILFPFVVVADVYLISESTNEFVAISDVVAGNHT